MFCAGGADVADKAQTWSGHGRMEAEEALTRQLDERADEWKGGRGRKGRTGAESAWTWWFDGPADGWTGANKAQTGRIGWTGVEEARMGGWADWAVKGGRGADGRTWRLEAEETQMSGLDG